MSINVQSLFKAYDELSQVIGKNHNLEEDFATLKIMFDEQIWDILTIGEFLKIIDFLAD